MNLCEKVKSLAPRPGQVDVMLDLLLQMSEILLLCKNRQYKESIFDLKVGF